MPTATWASCSTSGDAVSRHRYGHETYIGKRYRDRRGRPYRYFNDLHGYSMFHAVVRDSLPTLPGPRASGCKPLRATLHIRPDRRDIVGQYCLNATLQTRELWIPFIVSAFRRPV